jgi:hypothetical protein
LGNPRSIIADKFIPTTLNINAFLRRLSGSNVAAIGVILLTLGNTGHRLIFDQASVRANRGPANGC